MRIRVLRQGYGGTFRTLRARFCFTNGPGVDSATSSSTTPQQARSSSRLFDSSGVFSTSRFSSPSQSCDSSRIRGAPRGCVAPAGCLFGCCVVGGDDLRHCLACPQLALSASQSASMGRYDRQLAHRGASAPDEPAGCAFFPLLVRSSSTASVSLPGLAVPH